MLLKRSQWDMKPRKGQNKTTLHTAGNRDVPSGIKGSDSTPLKFYRVPAPIYDVSRPYLIIKDTPDFSMF